MEAYISKYERSHQDTIKCDGFEELEEGVRLYNEPDDGAPTQQDDIAYVPHDALRYILPGDEN